MTLNVGDIVQVVMTWDAPVASVAQNVWHYEMVSGAGADEADFLAGVEVVCQAVSTEIDSFQADDFEATLLEGFVRDTVAHQWNGFGSEALTSVIGASVADYEPHGVAALGRYLTQALRRQGRTFMPGLIESAIVAGVLSAGAEAALALAMLEFIADVSVTGGLFTLCTYNVDATSALYETSSLEVGTIIANSLPAYQRRRKPGVGL